MSDRRWLSNAGAVTFNAITHVLAEQGEWVPLSARQHATEAVLAALDEIGALTYEPFVAGSGDRDVIDMGFLSLPAEIQAEAERAASVRPEPDLTARIAAVLGQFDWRYEYGADDIERAARAVARELNGDQR